MSETITPPAGQSDSDVLGEGGKKALEAERARASEAEKRAKAAEARVQELEASVKAAQDAADETATAVSAELAAKQAGLDKLGLQVTKLTIGIEEKLPLNLIERMQGDDEEALRADAKELAGFVPDTNPSPFPKADLSQGAKETISGGTTADKFASFMESKLS